MPGSAFGEFGEGYLRLSYAIHLDRLREAVERDGTAMLTVDLRPDLSVEALAGRFGVTLQTVRRDVQRLSEKGLLMRFHGGVRAPSSTVENLAHNHRESLHSEGKARIARAVAQAATAKPLPGFQVLWSDAPDGSPDEAAKESERRWAAESPKRYLAATIAVPVLVGRQRWSLSVGGATS